jgi:hypothetical protein
MTKVELISDVQKYFDYLTSDEINVFDANFVSEEVIEIHYENNENFIAQIPKRMWSSLLLPPPMPDSNCTMCWIN